MAREPEVRSLCHGAANQLQAIVGWYEMGSYTVALEALLRLKNITDQLLDVIDDGRAAIAKPMEPYVDSFTEEEESGSQSNATGNKRGAGAANS